mgnify:CR=1 FL=1
MAQTIIYEFSSQCYVGYLGYYHRQEPNPLPLLSLVEADAFLSNCFLLFNLASFNCVLAISISSSLRSNCWILKANRSSLVIASCHGGANHEAIVCSIRTFRFCQKISLAGMYLVTVLWVVLSAHSAYDNKRDHSPNFP